MPSNPQALPIQVDSILGTGTFYARLIPVNRATPVGFTIGSRLEFADSYSVSVYYMDNSGNWSPLNTNIVSQSPGGFVASFNAEATGYAKYTPSSCIEETVDPGRLRVHDHISDEMKLYIMRSSSEWTIFICFTESFNMYVCPSIQVQPNVELYIISFNERDMQTIDSSKFVAAPRSLAIQAGGSEVTARVCSIDDWQEPAWTPIEAELIGSGNSRVARLDILAGFVEVVESQ